MYIFITVLLEHVNKERGKLPSELNTDVQSEHKHFLKRDSNSAIITIEIVNRTEHTNLPDLRRCKWQDHPKPLIGMWIICGGVKCVQIYYGNTNAT
jgi:hypothetical protein